MRLREEIDRLRKLLAARPDDPMVALELGDLLQRERNIPEAIAVYERAAEIYRRQGFEQKVVAVYTTILKLDPNRLDAHFHLARAYKLLGVKEDAEFHLRRAAAAYAKKGDEFGLRMAKSELERMRVPN